MEMIAGWQPIPAEIKKDGVFLNLERAHDLSD